MKTDDLMINDRVPYLFGRKVFSGKILGIRIVTDIVSGKRVGVFTDRSFTVAGDDGSIRGDFKADNFREAAAKRLEHLRGELDAERISTGELAELQELTPFIDAGDVQLLEAAGVPEGEG